MTELEKRLVEFALLTLQILEDEKDWTTDELDYITSASISTGLVVPGPDYFEAVTEVKNYKDEQFPNWKK